MRRNNPNNQGMMNDSIQDLDRELALLRRKRELIEEQQQLLNRPVGHNISPWENSPQRGFNNHNNQQRFLMPEVVNMYDNGRGFNQRSDRKRHAEPSQSWEPAPKRFDRPGSRRGRDDSSRPRFNERFNPKAQPVRSTYRPRSRSNQVPKPGPAPAASKNAVKKTQVQQQKVQHRAEAAPSTDDILRAEGEPSLQVQGRLELALGEVYSQVRAQNPNLPPTFFTGIANGKLMRQAIRSRIRSVLLGQLVGSKKDIVAAYWRAFPDAQEIVRLVPSYVTQHKAAPSDPSDPSAPSAPSAPKRERIQAGVFDHLKKYGHKMLEKQLSEMFRGLEKMYPEEDIENQIDILRDIIQVESSEFDKIKAFIIDGLKTVNENNDAVKTAELNADAATGNTELPANTQSTETAANSAEADGGVKPTVDNNEEVKTDKDKNDAVNDAETSAAEVPEDISKKEENEVKIEKINILYEKLFTSVFKFKVPQLLNKFKWLMMKIILNILKSGVAGVEATNEKDGGQAHKNSKEGAGKTQNSPNSIKPPIPFFVAVVGKPRLPRRAQLSEFLTQFKPLSIKKPTKLYNILFVGFGDKESYEKILAATNTELGGCRLTIKPSDKTKKQTEAADPAPGPAPVPAPAPAPAPVVDDQSFAEDIKMEEDRKGDVSINSEMDNQIDDLLNSIKEDTAVKAEIEANEEELLKETELLNNALTSQEGKIVIEETGLNETEEVNETEAGAENGDEENGGDDNGKGEEDAKVADAEDVKEAEAEPTPEPVRATRRTSRLVNK